MLKDHLILVPATMNPYRITGVTCIWNEQCTELFNISSITDILIYNYGLPHFNKFALAYVAINIKYDNNKYNPNN